MVSNLELQNKIAILLVSHGSSLPFAEVTFNEIKDKFSMNKVSLSNEVSFHDIPSSIGKKNEALNALMVLGYLKQEVLPYLSNLSENLSIEEMIQSTLKYMSKGG